MTTTTTTTTGTDSSNNTQGKLRMALLALLQGLDEHVLYFDWEVMSEDKNGLFQLLGFHSYMMYFEFLVSCGFACHQHNRTKMPSFKNLQFEQSYPSRLTRKKKSCGKKFWFLQIGHPSPLRNSSTKLLDPPQTNLKRTPSARFWSSTIVEKWSKELSFFDKQCAFLGYNENKGKRKVTSTPSTISRYGDRQPTARMTPKVLNTPKVTPIQQLPKRLRFGPTPSRGKRYSSPAKLAQTQTIASPISTNIAPLQDIVMPQNRNHSSQRFTSTTVQGAGPFSPHFMSPTKASQARNLPQSPAQGIRLVDLFAERPTTQPAKPPATTHQQVASVAPPKSHAGDPGLAQVPVPQSESENFPPTISKLYQPLFYQVRGDMKKCKEGFEFKSCDVDHGGQKERHYFHVSKGWDLECRVQHLKREGTSKAVFFPVPAGKTAKGKTQYTTLKNRAETAEAQLKWLQEKRAKKSFCSNSFSRRLLSGLMAYHPKVSAQACEEFYPLIVGSFFQESPVPLTIDQLKCISPCRITCENLIAEFSAESLMLHSERINYSKIYYCSHDKADAMKGPGGCVKLLSTFDDRMVNEKFPDGQVVVATIDADKSGDSSEDVAENISYSVVKLELEDEAECHGVTSDSGGGGNTESGARELSTRMHIVEDALVGNCVMHNLNLEFSVAVKKVLMGDTLSPEEKSRGKIPRNVEQLIYTAYAWEHELGCNVMKEFWDSSAAYCMQKAFEQDEDDDDDKVEQAKKVVMMFLFAPDGTFKGQNFVVMKRGMETRWWTLGEAADILLTTLEMRRFMAMNYDDTKDTKEKTRKICQDFLSLSADKVLLCDLALIKGYHRFYAAQHLKFYQSADLYTRKAGFQPFSVFVRCFLQDEDYNNMRNNWESIPQFSRLVDRLTKIPSDETLGNGRNILELEKSKIDDFFRFAHLEHKKMFARWFDVNRLLFLGAFSEYETGKSICRRLLGDRMLTEGDYNQDWFSKNNNRTIHLGRFSEFVARHIPVTAFQTSHIIKNRDLFQKIARQSFDIWKYKDPTTKKDRRNILNQYGPFFSSQQGAERANKDQNLAALNQRKEANSSARLMAMASIKELCETTIYGEKKTTLRGKKKIQEIYHRITLVHESLEALKANLGNKAFLEKKKRIMAKQKESYTKILAQKAKGKFEAALKTQHIISVKEATIGFEVSPLSERKLQLGKLHDKGTNNLVLLQQELKCRQEADSVETIILDKILDVKAAVKVHEAKRCQDAGLSYNPQFFQPLYTTFLDYKYKEVG